MRIGVRAIVIVVFLIFQLAFLLLFVSYLKGVISYYEVGVISLTQEIEREIEEVFGRAKPSPATSYALMGTASYSSSIHSTKGVETRVICDPNWCSSVLESDCSFDLSRISEIEVCKAERCYEMGWISSEMLELVRSNLLHSCEMADVEKCICVRLVEESFPVPCVRSCDYLCLRSMTFASCIEGECVC